MHLLLFALNIIILANPTKPEKSNVLTLNWPWTSSMPPSRQCFTVLGKLAKSSLSLPDGDSRAGDIRGHCGCGWPPVVSTWLCRAGGGRRGAVRWWEVAGRRRRRRRRRRRQPPVTTLAQLPWESAAVPQSPRSGATVEQSTSRHTPYCLCPC